MKYLILFLLSGILSFFLTVCIRRVAWHFRIVDDPAGAKRKAHGRVIPFLGGIAVYLAFFLSFLFFVRFDTTLFSELLVKNIVGLYFACTIIIIGGILDDHFSLPPKITIWFPIISIFVVIASGIGIELLSNPFGAAIDLTRYEIGLFWYKGTLLKFTILADIFTFVWLLGLTYTTKVLDGLDGLVSGVVVIGALILLFFSLSRTFYDPAVALLASILAGSFFGFLILNWHPASIFLGEGGSLLAGFLLGVLSILSGSKIAIAFLVLGIPILDLAWVIIQRRLFLKQSAFTTADRRHLHFRLTDLGIGHRQAVLLYYVFSLFFGITALFFQTRGKLTLLGIMILSMAGLVAIVIHLYRKKYGCAI